MWRATLCRAECLLAYGVNVSAACQRSAVSIDKILQGAKPAELPVQMPEQFPLTINVSTAKAIGLSIPRGMLERAESLVE